MATRSVHPKIMAHICVKGGAKAIAFYEKAFGARCTFKHLADDGKRVLHANLAMFGSEIMLHDEFPEYGGDVMGPATRGGASVAINVNLTKAGDVDKAMAKTAKTGAKITMPADDTFWGARYGRIRDPFGHVWAFNAPTKTSAKKPAAAKKANKASASRKSGKRK